MKVHGNNHATLLNQHRTSRFCYALDAEARKRNMVQGLDYHALDLVLARF